MLRDILRDFLVSLKFDVDRGSVEGFLGKLKAVGIKIVVFGTLAAKAISSVINKFQQMTDSAIDFAKFQNQLLKISEISGFSVDQINAFGYAAEQMGGSVEAATDTLKSFAQMVQEAYVGRGNGIETFARLGIRVRDMNGQLRSSTEVFEELRGKLRGLSQQEQLFHLRNMGIDESMYDTVLGDVRGLTTELNHLQKAAGVTDQEIAKTSRLFLNQFNGIAQVLNRLSQTIVYEFIKRNSVEFARFKNFLIENFKKIKVVIYGFVDLIFTGLRAVIRFVSNWVNRIISAWNSLSDGTQRLIKGIAGFIATWKILSATMMANPFTLMIGSLLILLALLDDYLMWKKGNKSLFDWSGFDKFMGPVIDMFKEVGKYAQQFIDYLTTDFITDLFSLLEKLAPLGKSLFDLFSGFWKLIKDLFTLNGEELAEDLKRVFYRAGDVLRELFELLKRVVIPIWDSIWEAMDPQAKHGELKKNVEKMMGNLYAGFQKGLRALPNIFTGFIEFVEGLFNWDLDKMKHGGQLFLNGFSGGNAFEDVASEARKYNDMDLQQRQVYDFNKKLKKTDARGIYESKYGRSEASDQWLALAQNPWATASAVPLGGGSSTAGDTNNVFNFQVESTIQISGDGKSAQAISREVGEYYKNMFRTDVQVGMRNFTGAR